MIKFAVVLQMFWQRHTRTHSKSRERESGAVNLCVWIFGIRSGVLPSAFFHRTNKFPVAFPKAFSIKLPKIKAVVSTHVALPHHRVVLRLAKFYKYHSQHNFQIYLLVHQVATRLVFVRRTLLIVRVREYSKFSNNNSNISLLYSLFKSNSYYS